VLPDGPVDGGGQAQVGRVEAGLHPRAERAERVEPLRPRPLPVLELKIARRDIVRAGVAEDHIDRPLLRHVPAEPADDHGELAFVVHPVSELDRVGDPVAVTGHRGGRLEEQHRLRGQLVFS